MHSIYTFVTGPLVWVAFLVFIGGLAGKFVYLTSLAKNKDPYVFSYLSLKYALRSIFMWLIPFSTRSMRINPVMTIVTFAFHICLIITPIFLLAHVIMFEEAWGVSWWTLPDAVADVMTWVVLAGIVFFVVRRRIVPEARYVTGPKEFVILALVALPFLTGFLAYHQIFDYQTMIILHVLAGEAMLVAIPFTWLSHVMLYPMIRGYMGSEFGAERHVKDW
jgi:nitrate reductase gamma subunit